MFYINKCQIQVLYIHESHVCVRVCGFWHSRSSFQRSLKALSCTCWVKLICHQVATGGYRGLWGLGF